MSVPTGAGVRVEVYGKRDGCLLAFKFRIDEAALRRRLVREGAPDGSRTARGALTGPAPPARSDTP